jgi:hypothetical protein
MVTDSKDLPTKLPSAMPASDAREQAEAYDSMFADTPLTLDDGRVIQIPPHPDFGMLDDEQMTEYEELRFEVESYDREPDIFIPEQRLRGENGQETGVVLPAETQPGALKRPFRKDGVLIKPAYSVRAVQAALGEQKYKLLREGGCNAADVWKIWGKQGLIARERQFRGSEADAGPVDLASVPKADSQ